MHAESTGIRCRCATIGALWHPEVMAERRKWSEMSGGQRTAILVLASVELALTATAAVDLVRRPASGVRGPKVLWACALVVQPVGPIAYLALGPRRSA